MEDFESKTIEEIFSDVTPIPTEKEENGMCVLTLNDNCTLPIQSASLL